LTPEAAELPKPRPKAIYWVLALALAGVLLYFSLKGIDWGQVWRIVQGARWELILLTLALISVALFCRAFRWRVLLTAQKPVPAGVAFWATAAGYLGNQLLPARAGEMIRTLLICRHTGARTAFVLTTALSERVVDAAVLVTITATVLLLLPEKPGWLEVAVRPFAALGFGSVIALALLPYFENHGQRWLAKLPVPEKLRERLTHLLGQAFEGIRAFHDPGRLARFAGLTAVIWAIDGGVTVMCARSIGLEISYPVALLLVAGLGLGSALPSTPGFLGIYQFVAVSILTPFGLSRSQAIAHILLFQAMAYVVSGVWGTIGGTRLSGKSSG
jgi:hypothetical protein